MQNKFLRTSALILGISLFSGLESAQAMNPDRVAQCTQQEFACQEDCVDAYPQWRQQIAAYKGCLLECKRNSFSCQGKQWSEADEYI
ncbi:MAG: hypothetical protein K2X28_03605 [Alphaproteobacteria bacterium]|nr:hypothetical protein [Alphaproteobacteria bacterium]